MSAPDFNRGVAFAMQMLMPRLPRPRVRSRLSDPEWVQQQRIDAAEAKRVRRQARNIREER